MWRLFVLLVAVLSLAGGITSVAGAAPKPPTPRPAAPKPADFGPGAAKSADLAVDGYGDAQGYHLELGRESGGFAWQEVALLQPAGFDGPWTGYQCLSGDGKYAAVAILPATAVNTQAARDHGAFAYSVDLGSGTVRALAGGVGLKYYSPGCGTGDTAVFTVALDGRTRLVTANLATGKIDADVTAAGQLTSAVPTAAGVVGVAGNRLVSVPAETVLATLPGDVYDVRAAADGGVTFLHTKPGTRTATAAHAHAGVVTPLGSGDLTRVQLFQGRAGHAVLAGATPAAPGALAAAGVRSVGDGGLAHGAEASSLDGDALLGPDADGRKSEPALLATNTGKVLAPAVPAATRAANTAVPTYSVAPKTAQPPHQNRLSPKADAAPQTTNTTQAQTPKCAVPPLNANRQVMQPNPAQVNWAVQLAEQGLLTGSAYTRPAGFGNMGLVAYAPNSDFPLIPLSHPAGGTNTVPRSIFEGIMAQESNWSQASWHAPAGTAGDPLIASYYGAGGDIVSINYAASDCGYGISQVTDGMHIGDHSLSEHGQWKVAVDYQENIAAGLQILETTWNQLYSAGITANNADPRYLENWYFAAWAYNSGIQPNAANGNTTGCTPGPSCTGPHGTWGLGWTNNPANLDYPPNRDPYLQDTYADAAHPASWPYQERVLGWTASPLIRYGSPAYAKPTYNGGQHWVQPAPFTTMCSLSANQCDPNNTNTSNPGASHCMLDDFQCWWHNPVTWIPSCATTCATSPYAVSGGSEPANPTQNPPTCSQDTSKVPSGSIIVDDEPNRLNLQGCGGANWSSNGTFTYTYGTNSAGDPIGAIDTHQLGTGLGGRVLFTHTEDGSNPALINTGVWTPNLPSLQYYKVKLHLPGLGAEATNVVYDINPGGGVPPWKIRVNQAWNSEQWVTIGTFAMENGGNVTLNNNGSSQDNGGFGYSDFDVAYDAVAFVPMGGTPGQPIGGPPGVIDAPKGSNPAYIQCGCARRTAGDPVDTTTGYFGQDFTDLTTPGRGAQLTMTRSYAEAIADPQGPNKALAADGPLGWGWTFTYNQTATTDPANGNVTVRQEDASSVTFVNSGGSYTPSAPRFDATLVKSGSTYIYTRQGQATFTYDVATGHLLSEQDLAGSKASPPYSTTLAYDAAGHLATVTDPAQRVYTFTWTGAHITKLADSAGRVVTYSYDAGDNLTDVVDAGGAHSQYGYDAHHLMTSMRSPANYGGPASAATSMVYDDAERVTKQTDANGHATTFAYGGDGTTLVTDPAGHQTQFTYANGLLTKEIKGFGTPDAGTWSYTYDPVTLGVSTATDPDGHLTTYTYDDHGNRTSQSDALGNTTNFQYDDHGNLVETIGPDGVAQVEQFDQAGHIPAGAAGVLDHTSTTVTRANNVVESTTGNFGPEPVRTTNYYYDDSAHPADPTRVVDALGKTTTTAYDAFGDKTSVTDATGARSESSFDTARGWLLTSTTPSGHVTTYTRDAWGQVTKTTDALGHSVSNAYDLDGHVVSTTDGNGKTGTVTYDPVGQAVQATAADGTDTKTDYNPDGTVADAVDGLGAKTTYGYDGQGRKASRTDPDSHVVRTTSDPAGRVTSSTDAAGRATTMTYDAAGELVSVTYADPATAAVSFRYDQAGRKIGMTDATGTTNYTYDVFGELVKKTTGTGVPVSYGFDDGGNLTAIIYPGRTTPVARAFDADNRLASVTDTSGNKTAFDYSADGVLAKTTFPNGDVVTNGYDTTDTLTSATVSGPGAGSLTLGRDNAGQVGSRQDNSAAATTYSYTDREQLAATAGGSTAAFAYDKADNPVQVGATTQAFDAAGQLCWTSTAAGPAPACATAPAGAQTFTFDPLGERTAQSGTGAGYGYDQNSRLTSFTKPGTTSSYRYDGAGTRVAKTVGGVTTSFVYDDAALSNLLTDGTNDYLYGPGGLPVEQTSAAGTYWFVHDQIGSTTALLDASGARVAAYTYSPYGGVSATGTVSTPLRYTGQYTDAESGLVFLRARYYDPATAEFLTVDPDVDVTGTPYAYAGGNPVNAVDLSGRDWWNPFSWSSDTWKNIGQGALAGAAIVGTAACLIAEPCGLGELAIAGGGAVAAGGISIGTAASWGAAAGAYGGLMYSVSHGGTSSGNSGSGNGSSRSAADANRQASKDYGRQQSQMDHVFVPKHKLGALIQSCGSEGATMDQIIDSVQGAADGIYGKTNPLIRVINGFTVTIRGAMINGVFKIGTAFIP
ncbi:RHS repeat-associated core domain-containing protein [Amycolatopsis sp. MEPSY49]|uniref:RHS repeat-associated core domain-containing protein n=1 Tax=Amycolatopsis sp. MEPSY49 TaxID=3151600 RepID=UPI003EF9BFA1